MIKEFNELRVSVVSEFFVQLCLSTLRPRLVWGNGNVVILVAVVVASHFWYMLWLHYIL